MKTLVKDPLGLLQCFLPVDLHNDLIKFTVSSEETIRYFPVELQRAFEGVPVPIFIKDRYRIMVAELIDYRNRTYGEAQLIFPYVQRSFRKDPVHLFLQELLFRQHAWIKSDFPF